MSILKAAVFGCFVAANAFALQLDFESMSCDFTQSVQSGKKVAVYSGTVIVKKPLKALWSYKKPIKKEVYVGKNEIVIFEPEIDQATVQKNKSGFAIEEILKNAKQKNAKQYEAVIDGTKITFELKDGFFDRLEYEDNLANSVTIKLTGCKKNIKLDDGIFVFKPSASVDIINK